MQIKSIKTWILHNVGPPDQFTIEKRVGGRGTRGEVIIDSQLFGLSVVGNYAAPTSPLAKKSNNVKHGLLSAIFKHIIISVVDEDLCAFWHFLHIAIVSVR